MKRFIILPLFFCLFVNAHSTFAQSETIKDVVDNLKKGDLTALTQKFNAETQFDIDGQIKTQNDLKAFIQNHPLKMLEAKHEGGAGSSSFAIFTYKSEGENYRLTLKTKNNVVDKVIISKE